MITHRYAQANNPLIEHVDLEKPTSYIYYLDANNLYGYAQPLPVDNFEWVSEREIASLHVTTVTHVIKIQKKMPWNVMPHFSNYSNRSTNFVTDKVNMMLP